MRTISVILLIFLCSSAFVAEGPKEDPCKAAHELWQFGEGHFEQGSPESIKNLDSAISLCPNYGMAWRERGTANLKRGDFAVWQSNINKAVEIDPVGFLSIRGWCRFSFLRDYEGAITDLARLDTLVRFQTIYASDFNIYLLLGEAYAALGRYEEALQYYDKDINNTIKERGVEWVGLYDYLYRGILKYTTGDYPGALEDFEKEIKIYESLADPYYFKGLVYIKMGKLKESEEQLKKAMELIKGKGFKHRDPYTEVQNEIYITDVEEALNKAH
jgi:tetratricopeptide (TPR) repeat protein